MSSPSREPPCQSPKGRAPFDRQSSPAFRRDHQNMIGFYIYNCNSPQTRYRDSCETCCRMAQIWKYVSSYCSTYSLVMPPMPTRLVTRDSADAHLDLGATAQLSHYLYLCTTKQVLLYYQASTFVLVKPPADSAGQHVSSTTNCFVIRDHRSVHHIECVSSMTIETVISSDSGLVPLPLRILCHFFLRVLNGHGISNFTIDYTCPHNHLFTESSRHKMLPPSLRTLRFRFRTLTLLLTKNRPTGALTIKPPNPRVVLMRERHRMWRTTLSTPQVQRPICGMLGSVTVAIYFHPSAYCVFFGRRQRKNKAWDEVVVLILIPVKACLSSLGVSNRSPPNTLEVVKEPMQKKRNMDPGRI